MDIAIEELALQRNNNFEPYDTWSFPLSMRFTLARLYPPAPTTAKFLLLASIKEASQPQYNNNYTDNNNEGGILPYQSLRRKDYVRYGPGQAMVWHISYHHFTLYQITASNVELSFRGQSDAHLSLQIPRPVGVLLRLCCQLAGHLGHACASRTSAVSSPLQQISIALKISGVQERPKQACEAGVSTR